MLFSVPSPLAFGRSFHLVVTPLFHVQKFVLVNWGELVSSGIGRAWKSLRPLTTVNSAGPHLLCSRKNEAFFRNYYWQAFYA